MKSIPYMAIIHFAPPDQTEEVVVTAHRVADDYEASVAGVWLTGAEAMVVCINRSIQPVYSVSAVYCTPSGLPSAFLAELDAFLPSLPSNSIVVGDLNFELNPNNETDNPTLDYENDELEWIFQYY